MPRSKPKSASSRQIAGTLLARATPTGITVSELGLVEEFSISRATANRILSDLALRGYAWRGKGRPTIIRSRPGRPFTAHFLLPDGNAFDHDAMPENARVNYRLMRGAMEEARRHDCLLSFTQVDPTAFEPDIHRLLRLSDRTVFIATANRQYADFIEYGRRQNLPILQYSGPAPEGRCVWVDAAASIRALVRWVASSGRRHFLMVEPPDPKDRMGWKREAFLAAVRETKGRAGLLSGAEASSIADSLAAAFRGAPPDALFAATDALAMRCADWLRANGFAPGKDVALFGFDHPPEAQRFTPPFSTIEVPLEEVGRELVRGAAMLSEDPALPFEVKLEARILLREG